MIGVLVKENSVIVDKRVYAGDEAKSMALIDELKKKVTLEIYNEDNAIEWAFFSSARVAPKSTDPAERWKALKPTASPVDLFLAETIGLEGKLAVNSKTQGAGDGK